MALLKPSSEPCVSSSATLRSERRRPRQHLRSIVHRRVRRPEENSTRGKSRRKPPPPFKKERTLQKQWVLRKPLPPLLPPLLSVRRIEVYTLARTYPLQSINLIALLRHPGSFIRYRALFDVFRLVSCFFFFFAFRILFFIFSQCFILSVGLLLRFGLFNSRYFTRIAPFC